MATKPVYVSVFSSFSKPTNDFFTKGFPANHKLEVTTSTQNGLTFISSGERKTKKEGGDYVLGKLETKYKWEEYGLEFTGTIDTDNLVKGDLSVNNIGLPGFKAIFKPQTGKSKEVTGGFEFQHQSGSVATTALWKQEGDVQITAAAVVGGHKGLSLGLESSYFISRTHPEKFPIGLDSVKGLLNYKTSSLDWTVTAKNQWNVEAKKDDPLARNGLTQKLLFGSTFEHKAGDATLHSALEVDATQALAESVTFQFGGSYKLDAQTTAQGKLDTEGKLTVHLAKQFNTQLKGSVTTEFNTLGLHGNEQKLAFGVQFKA